MNWTRTVTHSRTQHAHERALLAFRTWSTRAQSVCGCNCSPTGFPLMAYGVSKLSAVARTHANTRARVNDDTAAQIIHCIRCRSAAAWQFRSKRCTQRQQHIVIYTLSSCVSTPNTNRHVASPPPHTHSVCGLADGSRTPESARCHPAATTTYLSLQFSSVVECRKRRE